MSGTYLVVDLAPVHHRWGSAVSKSRAPFNHSPTSTRNRPDEENYLSGFGTVPMKPPVTSTSLHHETLHPAQQRFWRLHIEINISVTIFTRINSSLGIEPRQRLAF